MNQCLEFDTSFDSSFTETAGRSGDARVELKEIQNTHKFSFHRHSSGAVWESKWPSWAVRPNEPSGFRGRKTISNHASALVSAFP